MVNGEKTREYGVIASFYFLTVGFLYLWGYWSSFKVNILQYINWPDIIKLTLIPILTSFIVFVVGAILGELLTADTFPPGGGVATPIGQFVKRHRQKLIASYVTGVYVLYVSAPVQIWHLLPFLIAFPLSHKLKAQELFRELFVNERARGITAFLFCILPFYAYGHGIMDADNVIKGRQYNYVEMTLDTFQREPSDEKTVTEKKKFKFLGQMNGYVFLMPLDNKTVTIAAFDRLQPISLKNHP